MAPSTPIPPSAVWAKTLSTTSINAPETPDSSPRVATTPTSPAIRQGQSKRRKNHELPQEDKKVKATAKLVMSKHGFAGMFGGLDEDDHAEDDEKELQPEEKLKKLQDQETELLHEYLKSSGPLFNFKNALSTEDIAEKLAAARGDVASAVAQANPKPKRKANKVDEMEEREGQQKQYDDNDKDDMESASPSPPPSTTSGPIVPVAGAGLNTSAPVSDLPPTLTPTLTSSAAVPDTLISGAGSVSALAPATLVAPIAAPAAAASWLTPTPVAFSFHRRDKSIGSIIATLRRRARFSRYARLNPHTSSSGRSLRHGDSRITYRPSEFARLCSTPNSESHAVAADVDMPNAPAAPIEVTSDSLKTSVLPYAPSATPALLAPNAPASPADESHDPQVEMVVDGHGDPVERDGSAWMWELVDGGLSEVPVCFGRKFGIMKRPVEPSYLRLVLGEAAGFLSWIIGLRLEM